MVEKAMSNNSELFSQLHTLAAQAQWHPILGILLSALESNDLHNLKSLQHHLIKCEGVQSWTPLMLSCARAPPEVISLLLKCCPSSCTTSDRSGSFPLHFVCSYRREEDENMTDLQDVIRTLLRFSPESVSKQNLWGQTPLHCIFDGDVMPPVDAIRELLGLCNVEGFDSNSNITSNKTQNISLSEDEQPTKNDSVDFELEQRAILRCHVRTALSQPDNRSFLPLHFAASKGASEEILRMLLAIYPEAATVTTPDGDLPLHLLQYYAEDISCIGTKEQETNYNNDSDDENNTVQHRIQLKMFVAVSVSQIEALLEPLCVGYVEKAMISEVGTILGTNAVGVKENGALIAISERDEEDTENEISVDKMKSSVSSKASTSAPVHSMIVSACRSFGSRCISPIHIAAQHGVSYQIMSGLCEQYPEGAAIPKSRPISLGNEVGKKSFDIYPIELFENGRAQLDMENSTIMRNWHIANRKNSVLANDAFSAISRFHEKSDLLFAYHPEAIPSKFFGRKSMIAYHKESQRLSRLEDHIRNDLFHCPKRKINMTTRLTWSWLCGCAKFLNSSEKGIYQACIGRIITGLPDVALWTLGCIARSITSKQTNVLSGSIGIVEEDGGETFSFGQLGCFINKQNIKEEALLRAPNSTMIEMLQMVDLDEIKFNKWHDTLINFLSGRDGMSYSCVCQRTRRRGLKLLPKVNLNETGRTWNLPPRNELTGYHMSEFWQQLDEYLIAPNSVHLVYVTYYLEVSEAKSSSVSLLNNNHKLPNLESNPETLKGGLMVLSESSLAIEEGKLTSSVLEDAKSKSRSIKVEAKKQKKVASKFCTPEGCEVQLCFKYEPGNTYSLHVYGPICGGRVSISSAKIRKIVRTLHGKQSDEEEVSPPQLSTPVTKHSNTKVSGGQLQLHHALKDGVSVEDLSVLIAANPSSLLEVDGEGRTPLHTVFFLDKPPTLSIMETLLTSPGENATKLKDSFVRLPLHIAASRGASEGILRLLVEAYADGCYRLNKDGDLPLHLLVRSGRATTASVELLIRPILDNETICRMPGSQGLELPLHIAAEYNCSYKVLENLLLTYSEAASIQRKRAKGKSSSAPLFALDIFEHMKCKVIAHISKIPETEAEEAKQAARFDITVADLNLRSDLLFVFSPNLPPLKKGEPVAYRKDFCRLRRIRNLIRSEAIRCVDQRKVHLETEISDMARLGWCFLCTFNNPKDPRDQYAETVASILKGLSRSVVLVLKDCISNPLSTSTHIPIIDCATPLCKQIILSRIQFVGQYVLDDDDSIVHESDGSLVIGAKDYSLVESYKEIISLFRTEDFPDVDDLASIAGSIVSCVLSRDDPKALFIAFAQRIGFDEEGATREFERIVFYQNGEVPMRIEEGTRTNRVCVPESNRHEKKDFSEEVFRKFCLSHKINGNGERLVIIKFMKHRSQFLREKAIRERLHFHGPEFTVFPVIDDYDIDRIEECNKESDASPKGHCNLQDNKDALYAIDIHEQKNSTHNFSQYKYALVMPRGDKDLAEMLFHEECDELTIKDHMYQIGTALKELHSKSVIHGDLNLSNVVRYGTQVALIDFDSSLFYDGDSNIVSQIEELGSSSQKCCSGIMPPELIFKIDLLENACFLQNYEKYWKHVLDDVADMKQAFANSRQITTAIKTLTIAQSEAGKTTGSALTSSIRMAMKDQLSHANDPQKNWKNVVSRSLIGSTFEQLPDSLTSCKTIQEFSEVWTRLKANMQLWGKIHPRISLDSRYAYMVKSYDNSFFSSFQEDTNFSNSTELLPYSLVQASAKYDIWAFGVMLYYVCSGVSLLHLTYNGQLCNFSAYEELHNWSSDIAWEKISNFVDDPLAQNLLMKLLGTEDRRPSNMELILQHPFFRSPTGEDLYQILEEYDQKLSLEETQISTQRVKCDSMNCPKMLCVEKCCKEVFSIKGEIFIPTCFIILPYKLHRRSSGHLEAPQNISSLAIGEQIGKHLLDIVAATAKLSFWLKMKVLTSDKNGTEYRARLKTWLKRARTEASHDIAKEIIASIGCNEDYEAICVEMLDENMDISNAREFIKDPWKAASTLFNKSKHALLQYYPRSSTHPFYLIDELHAAVALPEESLDDMDNIYPIQIEMSEIFEDIFLPFINITVMSVTAKHGMKGLSMLLGLPSSYGIPDTWQHSNIGLVHAHEASSHSSIAEFAHLQQVLSKNNLKSAEGKPIKTLSHTRCFSERPISENCDASFGIKQLEIFYQQYDPRNSFCGLHRFRDSDDCNVGWTKNEGRFFQKTSVQAQLERKIQNRMGDKHAMDSQIALRHRMSSQPTCQDPLLRKTNVPHSTPNITRSTTKSRNFNKAQGNSVGRKIPSPLSVFTPTTKQTYESMSSMTCHSTMVSNTSFDKHISISTEPVSVGVRHRDDSYVPLATSRNNEYLHNQGNSPSMVASAASRNHHLATHNTANPSIYNHTSISTGVKHKHETLSSMISLEDGGYFSRQGTHPSMLSSVTLKKHHPTQSDISSMVSNSTLERNQGITSTRCKSKRV